MQEILIPLMWIIGGVLALGTQQGLFWLRRRAPFVFTCGGSAIYAFAGYALPLAVNAVHYIPEVAGGLYVLFFAVFVGSVLQSWGYREKWWRAILAVSVDVMICVGMETGILKGAEVLFYRGFESNSWRVVDSLSRALAIAFFCAFTCLFLAHPFWERFRNPR